MTSRDMVRAFRRHSEVLTTMVRLYVARNVIEGCMMCFIFQKVFLYCKLFFVFFLFLNFIFVSMFFHFLFFGF